MKNKSLVLIAGLLVLVLFVSSVSFAANTLTPAGTTITNTVNVNYNDASGNHPYVNSAQVTVTVAKKAALSIVATGTTTKTTTGNETNVSFFGYVEGTGNFTDKYNITASIADGSGWSYRVITDLVDGTNYGTLNGENLGGTSVVPSLDVDPYATPPRYYFVIAVDVPAGATFSTHQITVNAASVDQPAITTTAAPALYTVDIQRVTLVGVPGTISPGTPGQSVTKTIRFNNTGNAAASGVTIEDILPASLTNPGSVTITSGHGTGTANISGTTITISNASIAASDYIEFSFSVTVAPGTASGNITNTSNASYTNVITTGTRNESASQTVTITVPASSWTMQIERLSADSLQTAAQQKVLVGSNVTYHIKLTNTGGATDFGTVSISSAHTQSFGGWTYSTSSSGTPSITFPYATGNVAASGTVDLYAFVTIDTLWTSSATDNATYQLAPNSMTSTLSVTSTTVVGSPLLAISKAASNMNPKPGETVTYTVTCTNNGIFSASSVVFTDAFPSQLTYSANSCQVKAPGGSFTGLNDSATSGIFTNSTTSGGINLTVSSLAPTETVEFSYTTTVK